jgi:hypothetical protein
VYYYDMITFQSRIIIYGMYYRRCRRTFEKRSTIANYIGMQFIRPTNLWGGVASVRWGPTETVNRPLLDGCKRKLLESLGCRSSDSCRKLFFNLKILTLPFQCILSFLLFMIKNRNQFNHQF